MHTFSPGFKEEITKEISNIKIADLAKSAKLAKSSITGKSTEFGQKGRILLFFSYISALLNHQKSSFYHH